MRRGAWPTDTRPGVARDPRASAWEAAGPGCELEEEPAAVPEALASVAIGQGGESIQQQQPEDCLLRVSEFTISVSCLESNQVPPLPRLFFSAFAYHPASECSRVL